MRVQVDRRCHNDGCGRVALMSRNATSIITFGDGDYPVRMAIGELRALADKLGCGPVALFNRLRGDAVLPDDPAEIIRVALIGGGMTPVEALAFVRRYVHDRPFLESLPTAMMLMGLALFGPADEPVGKAAGPDVATDPTTSSSPLSTGSARPSASRRKRSTE